jgi:hypothetical protein
MSHVDGQGTTITRWPTGTRNHFALDVVWTGTR